MELNKVLDKQKWSFWHIRHSFLPRNRNPGGLRVSEMLLLFEQRFARSYGLFNLSEWAMMNISGSFGILQRELSLSQVFDKQSWNLLVIPGFLQKHGMSYSAGPASLVPHSFCQRVSLRISCPNLWPLAVKPYHSPHPLSSMVNVHSSFILQMSLDLRELSLLSSQPCKPVSHQESLVDEGDS